MFRAGIHAEQNPPTQPHLQPEEQGEAQPEGPEQLSHNLQPSLGFERF